MKKFFSLCLCILIVCGCLTACGENVDETVTDPNTGEIIDTATEYITNDNGYIVQPSNALQRLITGMTMCYLDYIVDDAEYLEHVSVAVTPVIIQSPADFMQFFSSKQSLKVEKAQALYDEMTLTQEGKAIYTDEAFYDSWNLIVLSVRESNADTKHSIDSVSYSTDSCIFFVNGTREVSETEGDATVRHFVFRVPKNLYNGVSHSFTKAE